MRRSLRRSALPIVLLLVSGTTDAQQSQGRQAPDEQLIQWLASAQPQVREAAIAHIRANFAAAERSEALDRAIANELVRLNAINLARQQAGRAGRQPIDDFPAEHHANVIGLVATSSRPFALDALLGALGTGRLAEEGIVRFAEAAVPALVQAARSRVWSREVFRPGDLPPHVPASALSTLRRMMISPNSSLSPAARAQVVAVAGERLRGRQDPLLLSEACKLAVATGDNGLRSRVQLLANNRSEISTMGIADDASVAFVQRVASDALQRVR